MIDVLAALYVVYSCGICGTRKGIVRMDKISKSD